MGSRLRSKMEEDLDKVFSKYIRLRDTISNGGHFGKCISCGLVKPYGNLDCGHFYSRYNLATRWDEDNCNAECVVCNRMDINHLDNYKKNLIQKIGQKRFDELTFRHNKTVKLMDYEIEEKIKEYEKKVRDIEKKL